MTKPTFLEDIGLREHLSMSRANGLNSMMKQISFFAMAYKAKMAMNQQ
jgi:cysteine desulfuration protein SufE